MQHTAKPLCFLREQQEAGSRDRLDAELQTYHSIEIAHSSSVVAQAHSYRITRHSIPHSPQNSVPMCTAPTNTSRTAEAGGAQGTLLLFDRSHPSRAGTAMP